MKRAALALVAVAFICAPSAGQTLSPAKVPAVVREAFRTKFPAVKQVAWKMKADENYEAEFTDTSKAEVAVKFDAGGKWLETETAIPRSKVPPAVNHAIAKRFGGYKVTETQDMMRWDSTLLIYEIHVENANETIKAQFHHDGTLVAQSSKPKPPKGK